MTRPPRLDNMLDEPWPPIPRVEDGQIIWNIGYVEVTTTRSERHGGTDRKVAPNGPRIKCNNWRPLEVDQELYYGKLHFLRLNGSERVWWRDRTRFEEGKS